MTSAYGFALKEFGDTASNIGIMCILITSVILACLIPPDLKRENIEKMTAVHELKEFIPKSWITSEEYDEHNLWYCILYFYF